MSRYFGDFLVEKGIISREKLLDGLVEQADGLPSTLHLISTSKLLSEDQIFQALDAQVQKCLDFKEACKALGFWDSSKEAALQTKIAEARIPFGQILVRKGLVDLVALTKAFDEFLAKRTSEQTTSSEIESGEGQGDWAARLLESLGKEERTNQLEGDVLNSFNQFFSDLQIKTLDAKWKSWSQASGETKEAVRVDLDAELAKLRGAAYVCDLAVVALLAEGLKAIVTDKSAGTGAEQRALPLWGILVQVVTKLSAGSSEMDAFSSVAQATRELLTAPVQMEKAG